MLDVDIILGYEICMKVMERNIDRIICLSRGLGDDVRAYHSSSSKQRAPVAAFPRNPLPHDTLAGPISWRPRRLVKRVGACFTVLVFWFHTFTLRLHKNPWFDLLISICHAMRWVEDERKCSITYPLAPKTR